MKKFSRASREITVTLICILACSFSVFDIAGGRFFQRLLISAGGELAKPAQERNFLSKSGRFRQICRNRRAQICPNPNKEPAQLGGSWPLAGESRFGAILGPDSAYVSRPQRGELGGELGGSAQKRRLRRLNGAASAYLGASSTTA